MAQRNNALQHRRAELTQALLQVRQDLDAGRGEAAALAVEHADLEALVASGGRDLRAREAALAARSAELTAVADEVAALEAGFERFCADFQRGVTASAGRKAEGGARREAEAIRPAAAAAAARVQELEAEGRELAARATAAERERAAAGREVDALKAQLAERLHEENRLRQDLRRAKAANAQGKEALLAVQSGIEDQQFTVAEAHAAIGKLEAEQTELVIEIATRKAKLRKADRFRAAPGPPAAASGQRTAGAKRRATSAYPEPAATVQPPPRAGRYPPAAFGLGAAGAQRGRAFSTVSELVGAPAKGPKRAKPAPTAPGPPKKPARAPPRKVVAAPPPAAAGGWDPDDVFGGQIRVDHA